MIKRIKTNNFSAYFFIILSFILGVSNWEGITLLDLGKRYAVVFLKGANSGSGHFSDVMVPNDTTVARKKKV